MRKIDEAIKVDSCFNRASLSEMLFVLLGRDVAAPDTIRHWCALRCSMGKNDMTDPQIQEALACADVMEAEGRPK
jgi:hypothetical protein